MAYTTINKSTDYFNTKLYTGNGSTNAITGVGFQPDWIWIKNRSTTNAHNLFDAVRGSNKKLDSSESTAEVTATNLTSFDSDGFTLASNAGTNGSGNSLVSWNWKANGAGSSNSDGSITSTVSVNTTAGFSIVKYVGNGGSSATVGHGLGAIPKMILTKVTSASGNNWKVYHVSTGNTKVLQLNVSDAEATSGAWYNTTPTSSVFSLGNDGATNGSGKTTIAYCFAEKAGYSKFGSFTGNGNADGTFVYTGFKPSFILLKNTAISSSWLINDNKRNGYNPNSRTITPNNNEVENTGTDRTDFLSNGFKLRVGSSTAWNGSGNNIIYMAFGQSLVGSNNTPCTAR